MNRYFRELTVAAALALLLLALAVFAPHFFQLQPLLSRLTAQKPALVAATAILVSLVLVLLAILRRRRTHTAPATSRPEEP